MLYWNGWKNSFNSLNHIPMWSKIFFWWWPSRQWRYHHPKVFIRNSIQPSKAENLILKYYVHESKYKFLLKKIVFGNFKHIQYWVPIKNIFISYKISLIDLFTKHGITAFRPHLVYSSALHIVILDFSMYSIMLKIKWSEGTIFESKS